MLYDILYFGVMKYIYGNSFFSLLTLSKDFNSLLKKLIKNQEFTITLHDSYFMSLTLSCKYFIVVLKSHNTYQWNIEFSNRGTINIFIGKFEEFTTTYNITKVHIIQSAYSEFFEIFNDLFQGFELKRTYIINIPGMEHYSSLVEKYLNEDHEYICNDYGIDHKEQPSISIVVYCDIFKLKINVETIPFKEIIICNSEICGDDNGVYTIGKDLSNSTQLKKIIFNNCVLNFQKLIQLCQTIQIEFINCTSTMYKPPQICI